MKNILNYLAQNEELMALAAGVDEGLEEQLVAGLSGSSRSIFIASLFRKTGKPAIVLTHNLLQAQKIYDDLLQFLSDDEVFLYPANELIAAELSVASPELKSQRIEVLNKLAMGKSGVFVVPAAGLRKLLPPKDLWKSLSAFIYPR